MTPKAAWWGDAVVDGAQVAAFVESFLPPDRRSTARSSVEENELDEEVLLSMDEAERENEGVVL